MGFVRRGDHAVKTGLLGQLSECEHPRGRRALHTDPLEGLFIETGQKGDS